MTASILRSESRLDRWILPGLAFKAVIIGGGYATGRELAEFFGPAGARGGLFALAVAMTAFSLIGALTFRFARLVGASDYRTFFRALLGPCWPVFEVVLIAGITLSLSVFSAAAGKITAVTLGLPVEVGQVALVAGIVVFVAFGNTAVERLFKLVTFLLYGVYATFIGLSVWMFGDRIVTNIATTPMTDGWASAGLAYAGYNLVGLIIVLPVTRHMMGNRDAVIGGLWCGPLAIVPAALFFIAMTAFPEAFSAELPSDLLLGKLGIPIFSTLFQVMIFAALLESGTGGVHAITERIAVTVEQRGGVLTRPMRLAAATGFLLFATVVAARFGLTDLIASGYRFFSYVMFGIFVAPLCTIGVWKIVQENNVRRRSATAK